MLSPSSLISYSKASLLLEQSENTVGAYTANEATNEKATANEKIRLDFLIILIIPLYQKRINLLSHSLVIIIAHFDTIRKE